MVLLQLEALIGLRFILAEPEMRGHANEDFLEAELGELPEKELFCLVQDYFLSSLPDLAGNPKKTHKRSPPNCRYNLEENARICG